MSDPKNRLWGAFCDAHRIAERGVPLFSTHDGRALTESSGKGTCHMLRLSEAMRHLIITEVELALNGPFDGLLYLMVVTT